MSALQRLSLMQAGSMPSVVVIKGRNDTRTPARPIEQYEATLKAHGIPVEVHWFEAGHAGAGIEQSIAHQVLMLHFACNATSRA